MYLFGLPTVTWVFSKLQGLQYYFPENSRCNLKLYESEDFPDSSLHCISESENVRFPFSKKNSLTWGVKWVKVEPAFENRREFIREASIILHKWKDHLELFSLTQAIENSRQFFSSEKIFYRKQWLGAPDSNELFSRKWLY